MKEEKEERSRRKEIEEKGRKGERREGKGKGEKGGSNIRRKTADKVKVKMKTKSVVTCQEGNEKMERGGVRGCGIDKTCNAGGEEREENG